MRKIIFNADDFNITLGVSLGIVKANQAGVVRSTSVMVNLPGLDQSLALAKKSSLDLGLHMNLTFGKPVLPPDAVPSLIDDKGYFLRKPAVLKEKMRIEEAKLEAEAQIARARKEGIMLSHIDSHHHSHLLEYLIDVYEEIAKKEGIPLRSNDLEMSEKFKSRGLKTPDNFIVDFYGDENINMEKLKEILKNLPDGTTEVMCHPGFMDAGIQHISSYNYQRVKELEVLVNPELENYLNSLSIVVIGYKDL